MLTGLLGVSILGDVFDPNRISVWGFNGAPADGDKTRVNTVVPQSSADTHDIKPGDVVSIESADVMTRLEAQAPWPGDQLRFIVSRPRETARVVTLTAAPLADVRSPARVLAMVERLLFVLFGLLFLIRRWNSPAGRALGGFLVFFALGDSTNGGHWLGRISWARIPIFWSAQTWAYVNAVRFTSLFPKPDTRGVRAWLYRIAPLYGLTIAALFLFVSLNQLVLGSYFALWWRFSALTNIFFAVAIIIAVYSSYKSSEGVDRQRLAWVAGAIIFGLGPTFVDFTLVPFRDVTHVGGGIATQSVWLTVSAATQILVPLGFAYAVLKHHILDIWFVVNRALVFSIVSAIVLGFFVLVEWVADQYVDPNGWPASVAVSAVMVLIIGTSLRHIHSRIENVVNDVFFHDRKKRLAALDAFARQSLLFSDVRVLEKRTIEVLARDARVAATALYLCAADGRYELRCSSFERAPEIIDQNDAAVIALRDARSAVRLEDGFSEVPGSIAVPMFIRGSCSAWRVAPGKPMERRMIPTKPQPSQRWFRQSPPRLTACM
ncbi:MAG: hypothetical protein JO036_05515 [Candidatus Eremiobacteraeota bacterium]|nr:hypothetical protein [Candidatus Eremiobacteraeota bacterium]